MNWRCLLRQEAAVVLADPHRRRLLRPPPKAQRLRRSASPDGGVFTPIKEDLKRHWAYDFGQIVRQHHLCWAGERDGLTGKEIDRGAFDHRG
jgi:hypothetical protein